MQQLHQSDHYIQRQQDDKVLQMWFEIIWQTIGFSLGPAPRPGRVMLEGIKNTKKKSALGILLSLKFKGRAIWPSPGIFRINVNIINFEKVEEGGARPW